MERSKTNDGTRRTRACLCWNCGNICRCGKEFPNGRPKRKSECSDFTPAPPEPSRITHQEMADALGLSKRKIERFVSSSSGMKHLMKELAKSGVVITYDIKDKRIYFYKEEM